MNASAVGSPWPRRFLGKESTIGYNKGAPVTEYLYTAADEFPLN